MKNTILFVSARLPYPAKEGHQLRALGVLKELCGEYDVHLLSLLRKGECLEEAKPLYELCKSVTGVRITNNITTNLYAAIRSIIKSTPLVVEKYSSNALKKAFVALLKDTNPDVVHLDLLPLCGLMDVIPKNNLVVVNEHNVESALLKQRLQSVNNVILKLILSREFRLLDLFERNVVSHCDAVIACSDTDTQLLQSMGARNAHTIANGVDTKLLKPSKKDVKQNKIVFLGGMGWYPNRLGVSWFINDVLPLIVRENSNIKFDIIGNPNPQVPVPCEMESYVNFLGFVDDFTSNIHKSTVFIVPLHHGSGTRLKVVEGLSMGKCIISTHKGAEGIDVMADRDIIFADTEKEFSLAVLDCLNDNKKRRQIEEAARNIAVSVYDWHVIGSKLRTIYSNLLNK